MNLKFIISGTLVILLSGCSTSEINLPNLNMFNKKENEVKNRLILKEYNSTELSNEKFIKDIKRVGLLTKDDPKYSRLDLNSPEKKNWFRNITYSLWKRDISNNQFMKLALQKYPSHEYEFLFIRNNF